MTNDAVPVTAEARAAYCDYEDLDGKYRERVMAGDWDNVAGVQAFARFERHILARHRGSTAGVDVLKRVGSALDDMVKHLGGRTPTIGATHYRWASMPTVAEVQNALEALNEAAAALASLSQTPATPMVQEGLREALAEAYRKGATDVHNYWVNNPGEPPQGDPEFGESASDYASAALDIFDSSARALSATPAQEGEQ